MKLKVLTILAVLTISLPTPVFAASTPFSLLGFFNTLTQDIQLFITFNPKDRAQLETNLAKSSLDQLSSQNNQTSAGPILDEYSHHLEKAVTLSSQLDFSSKTQISSQIANVIQSSTPIILTQSQGPSVSNTLSNVVTTNTWASKIISPATAPTSLTATPSKSSTPTVSPLKQALDTQAKAVAKPAPKPAAPPAPSGPIVHVPILMYHYVRAVDYAKDPLGFALSVTPVDLEAQMAYLEAGGFHAINPAYLVNAMKGFATLPTKPVILTFDDSYRDFYTVALSILESHHLIATNYVISDYVLNSYPDYMTPDMVRAIVAAGMNVGAHTKNHPDLTSLSVAAATDQIRNSRATLEAMIGKPVLDFAYPYGSFNSTSVNLVAQAGYTNAMTTIFGTTHGLGSIFTLTRVRISGGDSLSTFINKVNQ